jgi:hypothetical protein
MYTLRRTADLPNAHFNTVLAIYLIAPFTGSPFMRRDVHLRAGACILRCSPERRYSSRFISCRFFVSHLALSVARSASKRSAREDPLILSATFQPSLVLAATGFQWLSIILDSRSRVFQRRFRIRGPRVPFIPCRTLSFLGLVVTPRPFTAPLADPLSVLTSFCPR